MSYFDCALIPVPLEKLEAYRVFSARIAQVYREYGAIRIVDCLLDPSVSDATGFHAEDARDALDGIPLRNFNLAAAAREGETIILSWMEWPSKELRDSGLAQVLADPRVQPQDGEEVIFEGNRLVAGGFLKLVDI